jgi:hypothetical protein
MLYVVVAFVVVVAILFVASDVSYSRTRRKQWWHFRPSFYLVLGGLIGLVFPGCLFPAINSSPEERIALYCYPVVGFAIGIAFGWMVEDVMSRRRKQ